MCSPQDIQEDYMDLRKLLLSVQAELEAKNQQLYDCKRQLKASVALEAEYVEEIKTLQSGEDEFKRKLQQLQETSANMRTVHAEQIAGMESEISTKNNEISDLKQELQTISKTSKCDLSANESDNLREKVQSLTEKNELMTEKLEHMQTACQEIEHQNVCLEETKTTLSGEVSNLKEILNSKKEELQKANDLIRTLQDDFLCAKTELDSLRSKPLDANSRGNSLFAEVNDRRLQLQDDMNKMRKQYEEMRQERFLHLKQISQLQCENKCLLDRWKTDLEEKHSDEEMVLNSHKSQIRTLQEEIESYRKKLHLEKSLNKSTGDWKVYDNLLDIKNKEIESLQQQLSSKSVTEALRSMDLAEARREIRVLKLEVAHLQNELGQLKRQLDENQLKSEAKENSATQDIKQIKSEPQDDSTIQDAIRIKSENGQPLKSIINLGGDENKANRISLLQQNRKIQFSSDTKESSDTGNVTKRRGTRVHVSKPLVITTKPNT